MKLNNIFYLSKLNLKRNKKRTIRTIMGLSIGLILMILSIFLIFAFRFGFLGYLENNKLFNSINFKWGYDSGITEEKMDEYKKFKGITSSITYREFEFSGRNNNDDLNIKIVIDNITYGTLKVTMSAVDKIEDEDINQYSYEVYNKPFIISGTSNVGEGEILISTGMLNFTNETVEGIVGKKISIKVPKAAAYYHDEDGNIYLESSNDLEYLLKDFKVVGVYNQLFKTPITKKYSSDDTINYETFESKGNNYNKIMPYGNNFIVNEKSILDFNYDIQNEQVTHISNTGGTLISYNKKYISEYNPKYYQEETIKNHKVNIAGRVFGKTYYTRLFFENFNYSYQAYETLKPKDAQDNGKTWFISDIAINTDYTEYATYNRVITNISRILPFVSIFILIIVILNIFKIISYNVHSNNNYIGFMKASGLKNKEVLKLYLTEYSIYSSISIIISFIVSIVISLITTIIINNNFITSRTLGEYVDTINIKFGYYFLSFSIVVIALALISYIYTRFITYRVVNDKITVLLEK